MQKEKKKMWQSPWLYKESIVVVIGVIIIGIMLQLLCGSFNFLFLEYPSNVILAGVIILGLVALSFFRKTQFYQWLSGVPFSVTLLGALLVFTLIMGLTPQLKQIDPHSHDLITLLGFRQMTTSWIFVLLYFVLLICLGSLIVRRLIAFNIRDYAFYLNHIGLWVLLLMAGLGASDMRRYVMHVSEGEVEWRVYNEAGDVLSLPIAIQLNDFDMDVYPPKLAVINRETGDILPVDKPDYFQIDIKNPEGKLDKWDIQLEDYIHNAIRNSDSTYHEVPMPGATPAAKIKATNRETDKISEGWVCGGNKAQLYMILPLDEQYCVVMTQPEPKKFVSDINVFTEKGEESIHTILEVNKPLKIGSWTIYQYGYDNEAGKMSTYSSMELVYDPWINGVYVGIVLLALGSVCLLWSGNKKRKKNDLE